MQSKIGINFVIFFCHLIIFSKLTQFNRSGLTGTTASAAAISAASSAAAASATTAAGTVTTQKPAGLRRLGIRQIFNRNKLA
jgi:hypothetical protein